MRLVELVEHLSLDLEDLDRTVINKHVLREYSDQDFCDLARTFTSGVRGNAQVPADVITTLWGICDWYREYEYLTPKQQVYVLHNVLDHWHQMSVASRADLML